MTNRAKLPAFIAFILLLASFAMTPLSAAQATEKHSALVIDANSGKVLHAENVSDLRYPASLTKLMTLYMTFDALHTGRFKMSSVLKASQKAASMPSTNLRMKKGDRITVRDAIKALIVRSANDVAVILAEALAGSEYKFSKRMTATARRLGMKNTTFKNASGLPNRQQQSTARDLAVLALALKRHYPQYYHFFRTETFSYKGKKYTSHNRAMKRISGADGLKTGYIRASGFNLITSATRRGKSIVGIVLGGESSKKRDNEMVDLVERVFAKMNLQRGRRQFVINAGEPIPRVKPQELVAISQMLDKESVPKPVKAKAKKVVLAEAPKAASSVPPMYVPKPYISIQKEPNPAAKQYISFNTASEPNQQQGYSAYDAEMQGYQQARGQFAPIAKSEQRASASQVATAPKLGGNWGIQVGAYEDQREALVAASNAVSLVPELLQQAKVHTTDRQKAQGKLLHRARLAQMTEFQARQACQMLTHMRAPCFVYKEQSNI